MATPLLATHRKTVIQYGSLVVLFGVIDRLYGSAFVGLMAERGLTSLQIGLVLAVGSAALTILDFPTGNIADTVGRKKTACAGFLIWGLSLLWYAHASTLLDHVLAMISCAGGVALISGVPETWFVDEMAARGQGDKRQKVMPVIRSIGLLAGAAAASSSAWIVQRGAGRTMLIGGWVAIATAVVAMALLSENYGNRQISIREALRRNSKDLLRNRIIRLLMLKAASGQVVFSFFVLFWQVYLLRSLHLPFRVLGPTLTFLTLVLATGNALVAVATKRFTPIQISLIGLGGELAGMVVLTLSLTVWGFFAGAALLELGLGLEGGAAAIWVHDLIPSEQRASFISAISSAGSLLGICMPLLSGYLIEAMGFRPIWVLGVLFASLTLGLVSRINHIAPRREESRGQNGAAGQA